MKSLNKNDALKQVLNSVDRSVNEFKTYVSLDMNDVDLESPCLMNIFTQKL